MDNPPRIHAIGIDLGGTKTESVLLDDFGRCVGGMISLLDPDAVVIGGGLSNIEELYTIGLERIKRYAFHDSLMTPVLKNRLGDSAGVFGAAWIGRAAFVGSIPLLTFRKG